jgi:hypothetical protein
VFTYNYPARLQPGSTHTYSIQVRDTTGKPASAAGTVTLPTPWLPADNLNGPTAVDKKWAVRFIFGVKDSGGNNVQIGDIPTALRYIADAGKASFTGQFVDTTSEVINWNGGGFFGNNLPYPDAVTSNGDWTGDDFIGLHIGHIIVPEEGDYTFGVHSDDGFVLRIRGGEATSVNGNGQIDAAAPETIVHPANTGDSNTRAVYHLKKGIYRVEFFWWERGGGDNAELYAAKGAFASDGATDQWKLVGDNSPSQEFIKLGVDQNGWTVISSDPGGDQLTTWDAANADLAATGGGAKNYDVLDVGDPDTNGGVQPFPKDRPGVDDDDYALKATATLVVPQTGTYVLGFNSDDGAYMKIAGQNFIEILQNNTGQSQISGDTVTCDCLTGDSGTTMTIQLNKGNYPIELGMFERGGGSFLRARGAIQGATQLPLLAKNGAGTFRTPEALQLTSAAPKIDDTGTPPSITVTRVGNTLKIEWTGTGGTLETSPVLGAGATWTAVGAANPATVNIGAGNAFYRVRR